MGEVKVLQNKVEIPTYETGEPCKHPLFLDNRVYQGSSGKVYPNPVTESISDEKIIKEYNAIFLENDFLSVMILPELGGKIQRIYDKTNGYDAVYYNEVIKPALVGLSGPWTLGGVEFNWPQHHRPSTFGNVDYNIEEHKDGSITVWVGEIENMYHTKGMAGFTLYPDKAYLEVKGQIYNPTEVPQTFLWWTNPAVAANENTKSIYPPDVHAVFDYGKRDVSRFPIATGTYYGYDYSEGVDISRYKNIPVPTSFMAVKSEFDFVGNYDFGVQAGLLHIADHHISPGKKQWTWGNGNFGKAWERNLTDENGPYVELMAGVFTDNQPDFTFIMPYEEKTFKEYFVPYKKIGEVKNANLDIIVNFEVKEGFAHVKLYSPAHKKITVVLSGASTASYMRESAEISPTMVYEKKIEIAEDEKEENLRLIIRNRAGEVIMQYSPQAEILHERLPEAARAAKPPKDIASMEELYLMAVHIEQYRHAVIHPDAYYLEGLHRDPLDIRINNGYGKLLYKRGLFKRAEKHFRNAIERTTQYNPNPYDCEPYYNLGLALKAQMKYDEAYDAFYKSIWDGKMKDKGFYQLACVSAKQNKYNEALGFCEQALSRGKHNMRARNLRTALLRKCGRYREATIFAENSIKIDPLDFASRYELFIITRDFNKLEELKVLMRGSLQNYLELSIGYAEANLYTDAANVLALIRDSDRPMVHYYMAYYSNSNVELDIAAESRQDYTFPNRLHDIAVLNYAIENNPKDWFAYYSLGNLYYDKGVVYEAHQYWKKALEISPRNSAVMRNLAIVLYNKEADKDEALRLMERAVMYSPEDGRLYYELDLLRKLMNYPVKKRLKDMADKIELVETRDDLFTEYITLLNNEKYYNIALRAIKRHNFHPWEGGEGKISCQYRRAHIGIAVENIADNDYEEAIDNLNKALVYPENLGEGKLVNSDDSDIWYLLGTAYENVDKIEAINYYKKAVRGSNEITPNCYFSDVSPERFYFRALAYGKLGEEKKMLGGFNQLVNYCEKHIEDKTETDYFAISLPDFIVFDGDPIRENYVHCCYIAALGYIGKRDTEKAEIYINKGLEMNCSHQGLLFIKNRDERAPKEKQEDPNLLRPLKWNAGV